MHRSIWKSALILFLGAVTTIWAHPSTVQGKVTTGGCAPQGGTPVPNAAVTVTNTTTNTNVKVLSNATGNFSVAGLGEGIYRLDVEAAGFKTATAQGINLTEAAIVTADVCLEKGVSTDVFKFTASAPAVQTDNGMVYLTLNERQVKELPVID